MDVFKVTQKISFCYGHRIMNHEGKCAHPHGHNGLVELTFESTSLNGLGMVIDFGEIKNKMKTWIDRHFDHQMILKSSDPFVPILKEMKEPVFEMSENPTAECMAKVIYQVAKSEGLPIRSVTLFETPNQSATYTEK